MSRLTLAFLLGSLATVSVANVSMARAQSDPTPRNAQPITGIVRDAGVLHLATNTWTRKASSASLGADTIYDNTCVSGYHGPLSGDTYIDEGRVPSPSSPTNLNSRPGCATSYRVDGFEIGYCTDQLPGPGIWHVDFFETYVACATVIGVTPNGSFALAGLPGSPSGTVCWTVTVDLGTPPGGTALSFSMAADGNGTYTGSAVSNLFGWSMRSDLPGSSQTATGPMLSGNPIACLGYDGTRWDDVVNYAEQGTGMGTLNQFRIENGPTAPGCYYFPSLPMSSFHLELYADACPSQPAGVDFCNGDGSATPCPCANASNPGEHGGCLNSLGQSGRLRAEGVPSLANDTLRLFSAGLPPTGPQLFFQGTIRINNGLGQVFGDGLMCAGGTVTRLGIIPGDSTGAAILPSGGAQAVSVLGGVTSPGVRTYQGWYRSAANYCTADTFNLTNGWEVTWAP